MDKETKFSPQQVSDAIHAGLPDRPDVSLSDTEASELSLVYRDSLDHYREHVEKSIIDGDFRQAAEKSWGSFTQVIKALAATHGLRVRSHANILRVAEQLTSMVMSTDPDAGTILDNGANSAHSLHIHFYENDLPDETVIRRAGSTAATIDLLQRLFLPDSGTS